MRSIDGSIDHIDVDCDAVDESDQIGHSATDWEHVYTVIMILMVVMIVYEHYDDHHDIDCDVDDDESDQIGQSAPD